MNHTFYQHPVCTGYSEKDEKIQCTNLHAIGVVWSRVYVLCSGFTLAAPWRWRRSSEPRHQDQAAEVSWPPTPGR